MVVVVVVCGGGVLCNVRWSGVGQNVVHCDVVM